MKNVVIEDENLFYKEHGNLRSLNNHFQLRTRLITVITKKQKKNDED